jgi:hypothetical protein
MNFCCSEATGPSSLPQLDCELWKHNNHTLKKRQISRRKGCVVSYKDVRIDIAKWLRENKKFTVDSAGDSGGCISESLEERECATWSVVINIMTLLVIIVSVFVESIYPHANLNNCCKVVISNIYYHQG